MRDRFEMLFEHSIDAVFVMTLDEPIEWHGAADHQALLDYVYEHLRVTAVNRAMCEQMRATREELLNSTPSVRWGANGYIWKERMRELYQNGRMYQSLRAPRNDGTWMDIEGQYVCTYDDQGRITGHFGTQRDVTEKLKVIERLELAMDSGEIGIWDHDLKTHELYYDERFIERLGYSPRDPNVRRAEWWGSIMHPTDLAAVRSLLQAHLKGETPTYRSEARLRKANGAWQWIMWNGRVRRDTQGRPVRVVGVSVDITERKLLQERLFLAERMASIGTLAAGVGHEINNPLTYIVLNLTLLDRELRNLDLPEASHAKASHMIEQARYGTERVRRIVRDLQALTRVPDENLSRVELLPVLERCLEIADHQIRHRARVVRELDDIPAVFGSEGRLVQLFLNLLVNAAQAIPVGSADTNVIKVVATTRDGRAAVTITDSGVGIAADALGRIFDPFYTTKPVGEGTGLGLSICRSIVSAMAGEIEVDSALGQGTTFRVLLPAAPVEVAPAPPPVQAEKPCAKKRVLVIDDEPMVGQLVTKVLVDHEVVSHTSARSALSLLGSDPRFDLILCDVMMPEVSGMDFYARLAPELRSKIVFLSGGAFTERAQTFLDSVPNRRLAKPFDVDALTAVLLSSGDHDALP